MTSRLLDDQSSKSPTTSKPKTKADIQDDGYFETYSHYDIHKEMLQVFEHRNAFSTCLLNKICHFLGYNSNGKLSSSN